MKGARIPRASAAPRVEGGSAEGREGQWQGPAHAPAADAASTLARLRAALAAEGDPAKAAQQQAYMKSAMPFHGVSVPRVRALTRQLVAAQRYRSSAEFQRFVLGLWRGATHREERYAAIAVTGLAGAKPYQTLAALPLYETMVVTGAWWDLVDEVAVHRLGPLHEVDAVGMAGAMRAWAASENLWKRRSACLSQLMRKQALDRVLLWHCLEAAMGTDEFFLNKAIGWALRQRARTAPDEVRRFVAEHEGRLAPLSKREALKWL